MSMTKNSKHFQTVLKGAICRWCGNPNPAYTGYCSEYCDREDARAAEQAAAGWPNPRIAPVLRRDIADAEPDRAKEDTQ